MSYFQRPSCVTVWSVDLEHAAVRPVPEGSRTSARGSGSPLLARRSLRAHGATAAILAAELAVEPEQVRIERDACRSCGGPHGKPRVLARRAPSFNLSRSGDVALVAVAHGVEVGVDVEAPRPVENLGDLVLSAPERSALATVPATVRGDVILRQWVRKEAYLKGTGEGLNRDPATVPMPLADPGALPWLALPDGWVVSDLRLLGGYIGAVAASAAPEMLSLKSWVGRERFIAHVPRRDYSN